MIFLQGTLAAGSVSVLLVLAGYAVIGFLPNKTSLSRVALASLLGLAWVIFFASAVGPLVPLGRVVAWLTWIPAGIALLLPTTRNQIRRDFLALAQSPSARSAAGGLAVLWFALLLPFLVYPDLVFFDGKTNHDNFFWCVGAEYLQSHNYLTVAARNREFPLYNLTWSFCGPNPVWARMGAEGYLALTSAMFGRSPVQLYNFLTTAFVVPWLLLTLAIARQLGLNKISPAGAALIACGQPILFFFIANGNLPNLLGVLFSGGLWLVVLLVAEARQRSWRMALAGLLFVHGMLACYPEIFPVALAPIVFFAIRHFLIRTSGRSNLLVWAAGLVAGGLCVNPMTTVRLWSGILNSIGQVQQDSGWPNIFDRLTSAGYLPGLVTLAIPSVRLYGFAGGCVASVAVLASLFLLLRGTPHRSTLLISLSGFFGMLAYTMVQSFGYGWQKSAQFSGIHLAVIFPVLLVGLVDGAVRARPWRPWALSAMVITLGVMVHAVIGTAAENLKLGGQKGLTQGLFSLRDRVAAKFPGQPIQVDGATFRAAFFHSMWSAELFPHNPLVFLSRSDQPAGYLSDSVTRANSTTPAATGLYYVGAAWAQAFDYDAIPVAADRVGVLLNQHNLITEFSGFYRPTGRPEMTGAEFGLVVVPYADGWLEFTLEPNGPTSANCRLSATVTTAKGGQNLEASLDASRRLKVRFPLAAGTRNTITATISGGPVADLTGDEQWRPFRIVSVHSGRDR